VKKLREARKSTSRGAFSSVCISLGGFGKAYSQSTLFGSFHLLILVES
jgi:hypothetical protein